MLGRGWGIEKGNDAAHGKDVGRNKQKRPWYWSRTRAFLRVPPGSARGEPTGLASPYLRDFLLFYYALSCYFLLLKPPDTRRTAVTGSYRSYSIALHVLSPATLWVPHPTVRCTALSTWHANLLRPARRRGRAGYCGGSGGGAGGGARSCHCVNLLSGPSEFIRVPVAFDPGG